MKKKFIFNLKIIDENEIINKYSFLSNDSIKKISTIMLKNLTKIIDLTKTDNTQLYIFK